MFGWLRKKFRPPSNDATPIVQSPLYEHPVLVVDPGMHTANLKSVTTDAAGRLAATGSLDKTVRVWSLADGKLVQTIRMPAGPGEIGQVNAVAMSPDGNLVAVGGWMNWRKDAPTDLIYLFEAENGKMIHVISGLPTITLCLAFSPDGRYLAAGLAGGHGFRVFDRNEKWIEACRNTDCWESIYGMAFAVDGRFATTSRDGRIRLYDSGFRLAALPKKAVRGIEPFGIAFSPDGGKLSVGFHDVLAVELYDGRSLSPLPGPNLDRTLVKVQHPLGLGWESNMLVAVAWSSDGATLFAGSGAPLILGGKLHRNPVVAWSSEGQGKPCAMVAGNVQTIMGLAALPDGGLLVTAHDPFLAVLESDGNIRWARSSPKADFRGPYEVLRTSADGAIVDFGFEARGESVLRFDLPGLRLTSGAPTDDRTSGPKQDGLSVRFWLDTDRPTVNGRPIKIGRNNVSRNWAAHPHEERFVLGTEFALLAYDTKGRLLWRREAPGIVWAVNITGHGRLVVAACGDGTIRWHRMDDGRELLSLYVLKDKQNWVAWTPEGFYGASPGAFGTLRWHVNRGFNAAAENVAVSEIPRLRRPDALPFVLQELETARALGIAAMKAARRDVQIRTGAAKAPGARLHVLTIGISDYGKKAAGLALKFAHKDAEDVASALLNTC